MPNFKHVVETPFVSTFRTDKVAGMFDIPAQEKLTKEWMINAPLEDKDWQIGLIVGASGAGKTTISKRLFGEENYHYGYEWSSSNILDDFPKDLPIKEITDALSHVGFSSPPHWLLPHRVLSNGQKFRAEVARCIVDNAKEMIVFDEFTSVVDRTVAKVGSFAVSKYIRSSHKQFVAVTCHYDVEEWLQPDWVLDVSTGEFKWGSVRRPKLKIEIFQCHHKAWRLFAGNHYLSADLNTASTCFIAMINNEPAGFSALLPFPHPKRKNAWKEHRTVVLPDFQGIGLGNRLSEFCGHWLKQKGKTFISTTSHPAMIGHRVKSPKWVMTRKPGHVTNTKTGVLRKSISAARLTASFEYVGD